MFPVPESNPGSSGIFRNQPSLACQPAKAGGEVSIYRIIFVIKKGNYCFYTATNFSTRAGPSINLFYVKNLSKDFSIINILLPNYLDSC
jgi:hypothetical protein